MCLFKKCFDHKDLNGRPTRRITQKNIQILQFDYKSKESSNRDPKNRIVRYHQERLNQSLKNKCTFYQFYL